MKTKKTIPRPQEIKAAPQRLVRKQNIGREQGNSPWFQYYRSRLFVFLYARIFESPCAQKRSLGVVRRVRFVAVTQSHLSNISFQIAVQGFQPLP